MLDESERLKLYDKAHCYYLIAESLFIENNNKSIEYYNMALELFKKLNDSESLYKIGSLYYNGKLNKYGQRDFILAKQYFLEAANKGHDEANYKMGILYLNGIKDANNKIDKNYRLAITYLEKAAKLDNKDAIITLALIYDKGLGTTDLPDIIEEKETTKVFYNIYKDQPLHKEVEKKRESKNFIRKDKEKAKYYYNLAGYENNSGHYYLTL